MSSDYFICLKRAQEFVQAAELCLEHKLYNAAVTRAYYGALHTALAALDCYYDIHAMKLLSEKKVHQLAASEFDSRFTNKSKVFVKQKGILHELRDLRHDADYRNGVSDRKSKSAVTKASEFLNEVIMRMKTDGKL